MTAIVSFMVPLVLIGTIFMSLAVLQPWAPMRAFSAQGIDQLLQFLATLGSGHLWQGVLVMGATSSLVGMLFDTFTFCRYQRLPYR